MPRCRCLPICAMHTRSAASMGRRSGEKVICWRLVTTWAWLLAISAQSLSAPDLVTWRLMSASSLPVEVRRSSSVSWVQEAHSQVNPHLLSVLVKIICLVRLYINKSALPQNYFCYHMIIDQFLRSSCLCFLFL